MTAVELPDFPFFFDFPYQRRFAGDPDEKFRAAQKLGAQLHLDDNGSTNTIIDKKPYFDIDVLSDMFIEDARIEARRYFHDASVAEKWADADCRAQIRERHPSSLHAQRDALYFHAHEAKPFPISWAIGVLRVLAPRDSCRDIRVLDSSAGWGDRLLAAMAVGVAEYHGFDPNRRLVKGHAAMIKAYGSPERHRIECEPFEDVAHRLPEEYYDVFFTSPPFFDMEYYVVPERDGDEENLRKQCSVRYRTSDAYFRDFLFPTLWEAYRALKRGGYVALYIRDSARHKMCRIVSDYVENILGAKSCGESIRLRCKNTELPLFVWQKPFCDSRAIA
jgi:hypothetical protein